jgi:glycosyltransferase involved in cell wall biosynthesis
MITLAITTHNRPELTVNAFKEVLNDDRISEILIVDDHSEWYNYIKLQELCEGINKVRILRNKKNLGCYHNKKKAVKEASNDWVILFDSDNKIDLSYLNGITDGALIKLEDWLDEKVIYAPEFARPHFDYRLFSGVRITKENVKSYVDKPKFDCLINTCNFLVHKQTYLQSWQDHPEPWTADTLFMNYNWLADGNSIHVVEGMQYDHLVHDGSHYKEHVNKTGNLATDYMNKLRTLS